MQRKGTIFTYMLSLSCKYAIRACAYIMTRSKAGQRSGIREIALEIEANEHTTAKILQLLVREGIISSLKGPAGGFFIAPGAKPVTLIDIVQVVDGTSFFYACGLGLKQCSEKKPCPIHNRYKKLREGMLNEFSRITIDRLADGIESGTAFLRS